MQAASTPLATPDSSVGTFQRHIFNLFLSGMYALNNGYLLTAISLSSILVHVIDGKFHKASLWLLLCAALSSLGIMHGRTLDPRAANQLFPLMYLLAAAIVYLCHWLQNRAEQIRALQVQWAQALVELAERFPVALRPAQAAIDRLAVRLGLVAQHSDAPHSPTRRGSKGSARRADDADGRRGVSHGRQPVPGSRSRSLLEALGVDWLDESASGPSSGPLSERASRASREGDGGAQADGAHVVREEPSMQLQPPSPPRPLTPSHSEGHASRELRGGASPGAATASGLRPRAFRDAKMEPLLSDAQPP